MDTAFQRVFAPCPSIFGQVFVQTHIDIYCDVALSIHVHGGYLLMGSYRYLVRISLYYIMVFAYMIVHIHHSIAIHIIHVSYGVINIYIYIERESYAM